MQFTMEVMFILECDIRLITSESTKNRVCLLYVIVSCDEVYYYLTRTDKIPYDPGPTPVYRLIKSCEVRMAYSL